MQPKSTRIWTSQRLSILLLVLMILLIGMTIYLYQCRKQALEDRYPAIGFYTIPDTGITDILALHHSKENFHQ